jgi:hypothetical protein
MRECKKNKKGNCSQQKIESFVAHSENLIVSFEMFVKIGSFHKDVKFEKNIPLSLFG